MPNDKTNVDLSVGGDRRDLDKAARCGEPSYVWRAGQKRRLEMVLEAAGERLSGSILEDGCGVGMYVERLAPLASKIFGLEYDLARARKAARLNQEHPNASILCAAGEGLPFPGAAFDLVLSHEVLEHVQDDQAAVKEIIRTLRPGGRLALFVPNRGYPFETHGIYWRGQYRFGNIPLVNYLPRRLRDRLAPHVRVYSHRDLERLFKELPVRFVARSVIFGAYDNIIARWPRAGKALRAILQALERTPLRIFGLSHFWVVEKLA
ncbi:MAG: class I SAM-dependent methyltransferase [Anaerolineales bacterium]|nr:class I SAM-dependent methyltransferase [Anaerolineales bacterium]